MSNIKLNQEQEQEIQKEIKKELYVSFSDLYQNKQKWLYEKLEEGYRVFLTSNKGRPLEISFVEYR